MEKILKRIEELAHEWDELDEEAHKAKTARDRRIAATARMIRHKEGRIILDTLNELGLEAELAEKLSPEAHRIIYEIW